MHDKDHLVTFQMPNSYYVGHIWFFLRREFCDNSFREPKYKQKHYILYIHFMSLLEIVTSEAYFYMFSLTLFKLSV